MTTPFFSVVVSTYGRGKHIKPSIESVLQQGHQDFEVLVVGDGCTDETEAVVSDYLSPRLAWHNLEKNGGSQSYPNNYGIEKARGKWIAYLGHDDIWSPHHLAALRTLIERRNDLDFAVSGCIYYGPKDSDIYFTTGLFDSDEAKFRHFFPPSSVAHRRDVVDQIGQWADPRTIVEPVDYNFFLRAANAGLRFASTGEITVHKFAAGHRYLSSLHEDSEEQWAALEQAPWNSPGQVDEIVERSRQQGRFMVAAHGDYAKHQAGDVFNRNRRMKGIVRPDLKPLTGKICIEQTDERRALDWHRLKKAARPFRWSGPNPRPRILIPYTCLGKARITLVVHALAVKPLCDIRIAVNDRAVRYKIQEDRGMRTLVFDALLNRADHTIITLQTPNMRGLNPNDASPKGIAISDIFIEPATWRHHARDVWSGVKLLLRRCKHGAYKLYQRKCGL